MFSITDQGNVSHIIGLNVHYNREAHTLSINQSGYIKPEQVYRGCYSKVWGGRGLDSLDASDREYQHPQATRRRYGKHQRSADYASLVGSLLWIAQGSRPDITFAVGRCAQVVANP